MYAVDPAQWSSAPRLTAIEIAERIPADARRLIISGGNPAIHKHLGELFVHLENQHLEGDRPYLSVEIETQGSIWQPWLKHLDLVVVSPKPPSSGMAHHQLDPERQLAKFFEDWRGAGAWSNIALKFVVKDEADLWWACQQRSVIDPERLVPFYLSAWSPPGAPLDGIAESYRNLCELVTKHRTAPAHDPIVLPQLHAIAWGNARGV